MMMRCCRIVSLLVIAALVSLSTQAALAQDELTLEQKQAQVPNVGQLSEGAVPGTVLKYYQKQFAGPRSQEMHMWQVFEGRENQQTQMTITVAATNVEQGVTPPQPGPGKQVQSQPSPRPFAMQVSHFQAPPNVMVNSHELTITPDQEVTAGGQKYKATLYHRKVVLSQALQEITVNHRVWISDAVPVTGIVREEQEVQTPQGKQGHILELLAVKVPRKADGPAYFIELGKEKMAGQKSRDQAVYNAELVEAILAGDDYEAALQLWRNTESGVYANNVVNAIHEHAGWHGREDILKQVKGKGSLMVRSAATPLYVYVNKRQKLIADQPLDALAKVIDPLEDAEGRSQVWSTVARAKFVYADLDSFKQALARIEDIQVQRGAVDILTGDLERENDWQRFDALVAAVSEDQMGLSTIERLANRLLDAGKREEAARLTKLLLKRGAALEGNSNRMAIEKTMEIGAELSWRLKSNDLSMKLRAAVGVMKLQTATDDDNTVKSYLISTAARGAGMIGRADEVDRYLAAIDAKSYSSYTPAFAIIELYKAGKVNEALQRIENYQAPDDAKPHQIIVGKAMAWTQLAMAEEARSDTAKADEYLAKAKPLVIEAQKAMAAYNVGKAFGELTYWPGMHDYVKPISMIANLYADRGDYASAVALFKQLPILERASSALESTWRLLAVRAAREGNVDAFKLVTEAMTVEQLKRSHYQQAAREFGCQALAHFGHTEDALVFARSLDESSQAKCLAGISIELAINGDVARAQQVADELAKLEPGRKYHLGAVNAALAFGYGKADDGDKAKALSVDRERSLPGALGSDPFAGWDSNNLLMQIGYHVARLKPQPAELAAWVEQFPNNTEQAYVALGVALGLQNRPITLQDVGHTSSRRSLYAF